MAISFNQIPANSRKPLFYAEIDNSQANSYSQNLKSLLFAQTITVADAVPTFVGSEARAIELFGVGSMAHILCATYFKNNNANALYVLPLADDAGASPATFEITVTEPDLTASKVVRVMIGDQVVEVPVKKTNTKEQVATAIDARINLDKTLPFSSAVVDEVVTLTAKNGGLIAGDVPIYTKDLLSTNVAVAGVGDPAIDQAITDAIGSQSFEYWMSPYIDDTRIDALVDLLNERWDPLHSLFGHLFSVAGGTVAELKAIGERPNNQHLTVVGVRKSVSSLAETLVAYTGVVAQSLSIDPARPCQTLELVGIDRVKPEHEFNYTESTELLYSGISPLTYESNEPSVVRAVTTFRTNAFGADDISYLDVNTLSTLARIVRHLKQVITSKFARVKLVDNGTLISAGSATVSPNIIRNELLAAYDVLIAEGIAENQKEFQKNLIVERNQNDPNRLDCILPPDLVNQLRVFAMGVQFRLNFGA